MKRKRDKRPDLRVDTTRRGGRTEGYVEPRAETTFQSLGANIDPEDNFLARDYVQSHLKQKANTIMKIFPQLNYDIASNIARKGMAPILSGPKPQRLLEQVVINKSFFIHVI